MNEVVVITGAAGGIGQAICRQLIARQMHVVLVDRDQERLEQLARALGEKAWPFVAQLTEQDEVEKLVAFVACTFGRIDILINNAAVARVEPFDQRSVASIQEEIAINLTAPLVLTRLALPLLKHSDDPRVISTVSLASVFPTPESSVYCATKFGLRGAMLSLGLELAEQGIRVGSIHPGATDTPMLQKEATEGGNALQFMRPPQHPDEVAEQFIRMIDSPSLERSPQPSEFWMSKLSMLFPNQLAGSIRLMQKRGERGRERYLASLIQRGIAHQVDGQWQLKTQPGLTD